MYKLNRNNWNTTHSSSKLEGWVVNHMPSMLMACQTVDDFVTGILELDNVSMMTSSSLPIIDLNKYLTRSEAYDIVNKKVGWKNNSGNTVTYITNIMYKIQLQINDSIWTNQLIPRSYCTVSLVKNSVILPTYRSITINSSDGYPGLIYESSTNLYRNPYTYLRIAGSSDSFTRSICIGGVESTFGVKPWSTSFNVTDNVAYNGKSISVEVENGSTYSVGNYTYGMDMVFNI